MSTKIQWAEETWNPVTGCTKISAGCKNCYAERMAKRLKAMGQANYRNGFKVTCHPHMLAKMLKKKKPKTIFVNSMSDLFHPDVPAKFIHQVYDVMEKKKDFRFIVCTKRPERMIDVLYGEPDFYFGGGDYLPNVTHLVSVENQDMADKRIPHLIRFKSKGNGAWIIGVSIEPMLNYVYLDSVRTGEVDIDALAGKHGVYRPLQGENPKLDWVIVGGESGPGARPMSHEWVRVVRDACLKNNTPFFFKQWGKYRPFGNVDPDGKLIDFVGMEKLGKKVAGNLLDGNVHEEYPCTSQKDKV